MVDTAAEQKVPMKRAESAANGPVVFAMHARRPTVGDGVVLFAMVALAPLYASLAGLGAARLARDTFADPTRVGLAAAVVAVVAALAITIRSLRRRRRRLVRAPAVLEPATFIVTPLGEEEPRRIDISAVTSLQRTVRPTGLLVGTPAGVTCVGDDEFVDGAASRQIESAIRASLQSTPDGVTRIAAIDDQNALTSAIVHRKAAATYTLLAVLLACFAIEFSVGAFDDVGRMLALGANAPGLVREGQLWRLVTAGFLHANVNHILMNASALLAFGDTLERLIGRHRFLVVAILASLGGNLASAAVGAHGYSVGASSCVWGLIGALLVVQRRTRATLPNALVIQPRRWAFILGVNGVISLLPGVDLVAHVGGFVTGVMLAFFFLRRLDVRAPEASRQLVAASVLLVIANVACVAFALSRAARLDDLARMSDVVDMALAVRDKPAIVNGGAWMLVKSGIADQGLLARAERGARAVVDEAETTRAPTTAAYIDTLAWLRFRQGALEDAIALERKALTREPKGTLATALARFLRRASPTPIADIVVTRSMPGTVTIDAGESTKPRVLYVELGDVGLWRVALPAAAAPVPVPWPDGVPVDVLVAARLVAEAGPELDARVATQWFPRDGKTAALP